MCTKPSILLIAVSYLHLTEFILNGCVFFDGFDSDENASCLKTLRHRCVPVHGFCVKAVTRVYSW